MTTIKNHVVFQMYWKVTVYGMLLKNRFSLFASEEDALEFASECSMRRDFHYCEVIREDGCIVDTIHSPIGQDEFYLDLNRRIHSGEFYEAAGIVSWADVDDEDLERALAELDQVCEVDSLAADTYEDEADCGINGDKEWGFAYA